MENTTGHFISWTRENGRTRDLATKLGLRAAFIYPPGGAIRRYLRSIVMTSRILASSGNSAVFVMLPPTPLLLTILMLCRIDRSRLFFDLHTGFFYDPKWSWARLWSLRMMSGSTVVVTNKNLKVVCEKQGLHAVVLHDALDLGKEPAYGMASEKYVICPLSYANDEPVDAILNSARATPGVHWYLTGRAPVRVREKAPSNVKFTGFISDVEYGALVANASAVVALTNRRDTMQRAGYEALMAHIPVITSDFQVLREFFESAATYVPVGSSDFSLQVLDVMHREAQLRTDAERVLKQRMTEQALSLDHLRDAVRKCGQ